MLLFTSGEFRSNNHGGKKWLDDPRLNCTPAAILENYMKIEYSLAEENYDLIEEAGFFELLQVDTIR
jgi:hypothetical protein